MKVTRRSFVVGAVATCAKVQATIAVKLSSNLPQVHSSKSLSEYAAAKGCLFGTALRGEALQNNAYANLVVSQCNIGVPEGGLKWDMLRPAPDKYDFSGGDFYYNFLNSHGMKYHGHTLVWESALPPWFHAIVNAGNAKAMLLDHISVVVGHYAGKMHSWDVVNEAIEPQHGREDGLKITPWLQMIGPDYIQIAFRAAHEADPAAMLVYNENWLEPEDRSTENKRRLTLALLKELKKKCVPIHGLGIQSHLFAETKVGGPNFAQFMDEVAELGLTILITEMDIRDQHLTGVVEERDEMVAQKYYDYLAFMLQRKSVKAVMTWGLSSRYTWITGHNPRSDGSQVRPLPYDADLRPTPAWKAIAAAFEQAPNR